MWAIVKETDGDGVTYKEVEVPRINEDEVLIKVKATGICGSDIPIISGVRKVSLPLIPGHEFAGKITEVGLKVSQFSLGDRVTSPIVISCGKCYYCKNNMESLCDNIDEIGIYRDGSFAEYIKVPASNLIKLPDVMSYIEAASIDPLASAYHGIMKADIKKRDLAIIYGPGPIGLYSVQILKEIGFKNIYLVGLVGNEKKLKIGELLGADKLISVTEDELKYNTLNHKLLKKADLVVDATGNTNGINGRLNSLKKDGTMVLIGISNKEYRVDLDWVLRNEITLKGSLCYTREEFIQCMNLIKDEKIKVQPINTHTIRLSEFNLGLDLLKTGEAIKVIIKD